jgi:hypothetical protein
MRLAILISAITLFLSQSLWANENGKFVLAMRSEPLLPIGINFEAGGIVNNIYLTGEFGAGMGFGFFAGGGILVGRYFELGENKRVKLITGGFVGMWEYIFDICWGDGVDKDNYYFSGGPFFKFLAGGKKVNFDLSIKGMLGYHHFIYDGYYGNYENEKTFVAYPSIQMGIAWVIQGKK